MKNLIVTFLFLTQVNFFANCQTVLTENIVLITLDGFRWQEVFKGADSTLLFNQKFVSDANTPTLLWDNSSNERRKKLLPFFWNVLAKEGQLYGNRKYGNKVDCANPYVFSYPGYSEMLVGFVDHRVHSNNKVENPNYTVLEYIEKQQGFKGKVAAFSSWDVIPYVVRKSISGVFTNGGLQEMKEGLLSERQCELNNFQNLLVNPPGYRYDSLTFFHAFEYMKQNSPRVMFISLDETDEHGHGGRYDEYLKSAHYTDLMISKLWDWIQQNEPYKNKTTLIITTDHGRGKGTRGGWTKHGKIFSGSSQIWIGILGPDTPPTGEIKDKQQLFQKQVAKTIATFLGVNYQNEKRVAKVVSTALNKQVLFAEK